MTPSQNKKNSHCHETNDALNGWAKDICEAYKKYIKGEESHTMDNTTLYAGSDEFKAYIIDELDKFKSKLATLDKSNVITFYCRNSVSGQVDLLHEK